MVRTFKHHQITAYVADIDQLKAPTPELLERVVAASRAGVLGFAQYLPPAGEYRQVWADHDDASVLDYHADEELLFRVVYSESQLELHHFAVGLIVSGMANRTDLGSDEGYEDKMIYYEVRNIADQLTSGRSVRSSYKLPCETFYHHALLQVGRRCHGSIHSYCDLQEEIWYDLSERYEASFEWFERLTFRGPLFDLPLLEGWCGWLSAEETAKVHEVICREIAEWTPKSQHDYLNADLEVMRGWLAKAMSLGLGLVGVVETVWEDD